MSSRARKIIGLIEEREMHELPTPSKTPLAIRWLEADMSSDRVRRALLSSIDGHRNVIQLESVARALCLEEDALERLRGEGFIDVSA